MAACTARNGKESDGKGAAGGSAGGGSPDGPRPLGARSRRVLLDDGLVADCGAGGGSSMGRGPGVSFDFRELSPILLTPPSSSVSVSDAEEEEEEAELSVRMPSISGADFK